ncbi:MAG: HAD-IIIC family phosphatase [Neisseriaceae bacterium]|nr:HAD-IIIC family phosphatase [Neisseriaceae bacterium]MBR3481581.1 HAD-IIIC family phosphatase [Neisseriaceae bacterium]
MKKIVIDLDNTISMTKNRDYANAEPIMEVVEKIREYKQMGFDIVIYSSRNMKTYQGNIGKITANTLPIIIDWLKRHNIPFDEIYIGKPWCGEDGFYVDDRAIRPSEFTQLSYEEIQKITSEGQGETQ